MTDSANNELLNQSTKHTCPTHGHVLMLLGEEWSVTRATLSGSKVAELDADAHTIVIDAPDKSFLRQLIHELTEYTLEELGCHFSNFDGEHRYTMSHTQMDNTISIVLAAINTLRRVDHAA